MRGSGDAMMPPVVMNEWWIVPEPKIEVRNVYLIGDMRYDEVREKSERKSYLEQTKWDEITWMISGMRRNHDDIMMYSMHA